MSFQGLLLCGAIFKATKADESDAERRELEALVAEAAAGRSKAKELRKKMAEERVKKAIDEKKASGSVAHSPAKPKASTSKA